MKTYEVEEFELIIQVEDGAGQILHGINVGKSDGNDTGFEAAVDALESVALAHACEGIDITEPKYLAGLRTAIESCANNL